MTIITVLFGRMDSPVIYMHHIWSRLSGCNAQAQRFM